MTKPPLDTSTGRIDTGRIIKFEPRWQPWPHRYEGALNAKQFIAAACAYPWVDVDYNALELRVLAVAQSWIDRWATTHVRRPRPVPKHRLRSARQRRRPRPTPRFRRSHGDA